MCVFPILPFYIFFFYFLRFIATWKQPVADGQSSRTEKTAAWTSRERGRSTRWWDKMNAHTHSTSIQKSINIHWKHDNSSGPLNTKQRLKTEMERMHSSITIKHKLQSCAINKTSCFKNTFTAGVLWQIVCAFWPLLNMLKTKRQDPLIQDHLETLSRCHSSTAIAPASFLY